MTPNALVRLLIQLFRQSLDVRGIQDRNDPIVEEELEVEGQD